MSILTKIDRLIKTSEMIGNAEITDRLQAARRHLRRARSLMIEQRIARACMWLYVVLALLGILTSCSPYVSTSPTPTRNPTATEATTARPTASPSATQTLIPRCTVRTGIPDGRLNIRAGPGTNRAVIRVLREGQILTVLERGAWLKVRTPQGTMGFIYARYCR